MMGEHIVDRLLDDLNNNNGKISLRFTEAMLNDPKTIVTHVQVTPNTRVCVITLTTGHDLVGYAQVLDATNDVELIGQEIAYKNAAENIWSVLGSIAKIL